MIQGAQFKIGLALLPPLAGWRIFFEIIHRNSAQVARHFVLLHPTITCYYGLPPSCPLFRAAAFSTHRLHANPGRHDLCCPDYRCYHALDCNMVDYRADQCGSNLLVTSWFYLIFNVVIVIY